MLVSVARRIIPGLRALPFGVELLDAGTYAVVVLLIMCVTVLAAYVSARRAALVDPLTLVSAGRTHCGVTGVRHSISVCRTARGSGKIAQMAEHETDGDGRTDN